MEKPVEQTMSDPQQIIAMQRDMIDARQQVITRVVEERRQMFEDLTAKEKEWAAEKAATDQEIAHLKKELADLNTRYREVSREMDK